MSSSNRISVKNINTDTTTTQPKPTAEIGLRQYTAEDNKYIQHLFYSTYFNLVPRAVFNRVQSPLIFGPWLAVLAISMSYVPGALSAFEWARTYMLVIYIVLVAGILGTGGLLLFSTTDKLDITYRILEGIQNDLKDPDLYYRGTKENLHKGNFWVLTINQEIVGCVGVDHVDSPVLDRSAHQGPYIPASKRPRAAQSPEIHTAEWKTTAKILAHIDDFVRITLVGVLEVVYSTYRKFRGVKETKRKEKVLFEAHKPNEASIRRMIIKWEYQNHGLSAALFKRVILWANDNQIDYLYADCDELQSQFASILVKKYGFTLVEKKKVGYFQRKSTYRLDVNEWMKKEKEN